MWRKNNKHRILATRDPSHEFSATCVTCDHYIDISHQISHQNDFIKKYSEKITLCFHPNNTFLISNRMFPLIDLII